ncbi:hypothetical protein AJ79_02163 [Helicocarpus griseus UAMH5409]|uniref:Cytochrome P450 monooxygenase n=1 Tax=Helicocarpus griseus UAMH5409 TaxID=1447875 RepID=A0A2B7Y418_9EURO|nr:hypothetical protein AJ79_02163 [Helicocarpus griseus UAMH5409]
MLLNTVLHSPGLDPLALAGAFVVLSTLYFVWTSSQKPPFPLINGKKPFEIKYTNARKRFLRDARNLINTGFSQASVFRLVSDDGTKIVLDAKYANDIRSHHGLSFGAAVAREFHSTLPGFEPFKQGTTSDEIFQDAVRMKLTQSLGNVTEPLTAETSVALEKHWTNNRVDWHDIALKPSILQLVAQLSSKVFLGDKICRNPDWLRITISYTVDSFVAAQDLRLWPALVRPVVAKFLPSCRKVRREIQETRDIISPVIKERREAKEAANRAGKKPERYHDAMEWMEECAKGRPYDPAIAQLSFSLAAIHTTSDMITQVLLDICQCEGLIQEMRKEIISVIQEEGWKKTALYKLKLMDSVVKESQRLKPIGIGSMRRLAQEDIELSDKTIIPKGSVCFVSSNKSWDPNVYQDPNTFDPYRFLRLRETPGNETWAQLVSPSPENLGFGFGKHACPGRFFAANEVKIALCHMLLKYDIRLAEGCKPTTRTNGLSLVADPFARISIKRREDEIAL